MPRRRQKNPTVTRDIEEILDDMRENLRRLEELALFDHPDLAWPDDA